MLSALHAGQALLRHRREAAFRLLFAALLLATVSVVSISMIAQGLKDGLNRSSSQFMASDRQLLSPRPLEQKWLDSAERIGLRWSHAIEFSSMLQNDQQMQLVSVKAVDGRYPLLGQLDIERADGQREARQSGPAPGHIWVAGRLFAQFVPEVGEGGADAATMLSIGELSLTVEHKIVQEPDGGFGWMSMAPRVLMHVDDVPATQVIQPGSRIDWRYYFAGDPAQLEAFELELLPTLNTAQKWQDLTQGRPDIANALRKTERYLFLGGSLAVLLATLAVAMAARQFASVQAQSVAVMQAFGVRGTAIVQHYTVLLCSLGLLALLLGMVLGSLIASGLFVVLQEYVADLQGMGAIVPSFKVLALAVMTVLLTLFGFALPQLAQLRHVSPMMTLREGAELPVRQRAVVATLATVSIFVLLYFYTGELALVAGLLLAVAFVVLTLSLLGLAVMRLVRVRMQTGAQFSSVVRQGISRLVRQPAQSLTQCTVLALAFMLFALMLLARDSLINDWQKQLPPDAPNHFLINIAPEALAPVSQFLHSHQLATSALYPIVRGRLSHINGEPVKQLIGKKISQDVGAINRELSLTWMRDLPEDNRIEAGAWHGNDAAPLTPGEPTNVSIEAELADKLGVAVGDRLTFTIGGFEQDALIGSIRSVQWDSMRPNFYMVFRPGALDTFPLTYLTAFHLDAANKDVLNPFSRQFPTVSVIELDKLISKIQSIMVQASAMLELMLVFILLAALCVVVATMYFGLSARRHEAALLRTLGATRQDLLSAQVVEFSVLGLMAGVLAAIAAELAMWQLQYRLFEATFSLHPFIWWQIPVAALVICVLLAWWLMRDVPATPPLQILRKVG